MKYAFLFNRRERKVNRKVTQRYILKLCDLCGSFLRCRNFNCVTPIRNKILKTLILTEKPSVARDFAKALGIDKQYDGYMENDQYIITWAVGHLVELLEPEDYDEKWKKWRIDTLPIIPEQFRYKPISRTEKQLRIIKDLISKKSYDKIVIATDAGREGEVIARTILFISGFKDDNKLYRFWTSQALTPDVVKDGMDALKKASEYDRLWKAGQSRQIADWLVGMNGSRAATIRMNDLFSIGRVQTAVLSLLVDRRRVRENFKPEPYWILRASFFSPPLNTDDAEKIWQGIWFKEDESRFLNEKDAIQIQEKITDKTGKVRSVKKQKKNIPPPFLYSLTELQQDGNKKFGFSAETTLNIAQALYEEKKCLSYPRTDSKVLGSKNVDMTKNILNNLSKAYPQLFANIEKSLISGSNKRVFNDAKLTDHHALIPLKNIPNNANPDEKKIYDLVLKRFAAAFHPDCEYEQTEIITEVEKETFRTTGKRILKPGWQVVYDTPQSPDKKISPDKEDSQIFDSEEEPEYLPPLAKGDPADVRETNLERKQTTPPPEYSEALLLKDMTNPGKYVAEDDLKKIYRGDVGLGTQATRAQIIETLLSRKYAERRKKNLIATDKGCHLIETLRQFNVAKNLTSPEETARWEQQLHLIAQGKGSDTDFLNGIKSFVEQTVEEFKKSNTLISSSDMGNCPICGGKIIEGKRGFGCSKWRKEDGACRFVIWKNISGKMITPHIVKKLIEKKEAGPFQCLESTKDTKDTKKFKGILKLVKNKDGWDVKVEPVVNLPEKKSDSGVIGICPACGGNIIEKEKGYGCANWRNENGVCRFIIWKTILQKEIPKEAVIQLLESGMTEKIDGFVSKKGKPFSAILRLQPDGAGSLKVGFDFPESQRGF